MPAKQKQGRRRAARKGAHSDEKMRGLTVGRVGLFPQSMITHTSWVATATLTPAAAGVDTKVFRLSPYDPDYAFGGSSSLAWTQATALYGAYRPISVVAKLNFTPQSGTARIYAVASINSNLGASGDTISAQPYSWMKSIGTAGSPCVSHSLTIPIYQLFGYSRDAYMAELNFAAPMNSNGQVAFLHVGAYGDTTSGANVTVNVELIFKVQLFQPLERQ